MTHPTRKTLVRGSTLGAGVLLALALLLIVNYFGWKYHHRFDWTKSQINSLSEQTENVLSKLDQPIRIIVFLTPHQGNADIFDKVQGLVALYEAASQQITVRYMDPVRNLAEAQQLAEKFELADPDVVVVASGDDKRILLASDLAQMDFSGGMGAAPKMSAFRGEQKITSAILELTESRKPTVRFTRGHGERSLEDTGAGGLSALRDIMNLQNLTAEEWSSLGQSAVPADTDLLVIAGPTGTFLSPELTLLDAFSAAGGRILMMLDPELGSHHATGLSDWLAAHGVKLGDDVVVDPQNPLPFFGADTFFVNAFGTHAVTKSVRQQNLPVLVSLARTADRESAEAKGGLVETDLMYTSTESWGERDLTHLDSVTKDPTDLAGPVSLAVVVEKAGNKADDETADDQTADDTTADDANADDANADDANTDDATAADDKTLDDAKTDETGSAKGSTEDGSAEAGAKDDTKAGEVGGDEEPARGPRPSRLVVFGDSDLVSNRLLQTNAANQILISDTLNWLIEREELTGIPPKEPEQVRLNLTEDQVRWIWIFSLGILPLSSIALGLWIWSRRRR